MAAKQRALTAWSHSMASTAGTLEDKVEARMSMGQDY